MSARPMPRRYFICRLRASLAAVRPTPRFIVPADLGRRPSRSWSSPCPLGLRSVFSEPPLADLADCASIAGDAANRKRLNRCLADILNNAGDLEKKTDGGD